MSTLEDVARFHRALITGGLLEPAEQAALQTTVAVVPGVLEYGLGVFKIETPCGTAWGYDGGTPSHVNISLVSPDGTRQAVVMANRDANTWTPEIGEAFAAAYLTAFCGASAAPAAARQAATARPHLLPRAVGLTCSSAPPGRPKRPDRGYTIGSGRRGPPHRDGDHVSLSIPASPATSPPTLLVGRIEVGERSAVVVDIPRGSLRSPGTARSRLRRHSVSFRPNRPRSARRFVGRWPGARWRELDSSVQTAPGKRS